MIEAREVDAAIAELAAARNHTPQMCQRLANLLVIQNYLQQDNQRGESYSSAAEPPEPIAAVSAPDSEFLRAVQGKPPAQVWEILDDLMDTLSAVSPKVYESVLRRIRASG